MNQHMFSVIVRLLILIYNTTRKPSKDPVVEYDPQLGINVRYPS